MPEVTSLRPRLDFLSPDFWPPLGKQLRGGRRVRLRPRPTSRRRPGVESSRSSGSRGGGGAGSRRRTGLGLELAAGASPLAPSLRTAPSSARPQRLQGPGALGAPEPRDAGDDAGAKGSAAAGRRPPPREASGRSVWVWGGGADDGAGGAKGLVRPPSPWRRLGGERGEDRAEAADWRGRPLPPRPPGRGSRQSHLPPSWGAVG